MTGDPDRVKDRPQFEVDDTTTSYSPPRAERPRWVDQGRTDPAPGTTASPAPPAHWFDPATGRAAPAPGPTGPVQPTPPMATPAPSRRPSGMLGGLAIAAVAALAGSALTVGLLAAGGWLERPTELAGGPGAPTPTPPTDRTVVLQQSDITRAAAAAMPSIVTIVSSGGQDGATFAMAVTTADPMAAVMGSGILFHADEQDGTGLVLTSRRVGCDDGTLLVLLDDGRQLPAEPFGIDPLTDLAIIQVTGTELPVASIGDSGSLRQGQLSMVIGTDGRSLVTTITSGVISALGTDLAVDDPCTAGTTLAMRNLIQTDALTGADDAGGALVDATGDVVGVTTVADGPGSGGYAIPIDIAKPIMEQAAAGMQPLTRPWLGISYVALTPAIALANGLPIDHGAWLQPSADASVPAVLPGSPAEAAGLRTGDVLTAIDDQRIDSRHPLDQILAQYDPATQDPVSISVLRDGAAIDDVQLMLGTRSGPDL